MTIKEELQNILSEGVVSDIYNIEEAYFLLKEIGENAEAINNNGFGGLFGSLQDTLKTKIVRLTARVFERPKIEKTQKKKIDFNRKFTEEEVKKRPEKKLLEDVTDENNDDKVDENSLFGDLPEDTISDIMDEIFAPIKKGEKIPRNNIEELKKEIRTQNIFSQQKYEEAKRNIKQKLNDNPDLFNVRKSADKQGKAKHSAYKIRSIPYTLEFIDKHKNELPISEKQNFINALIKLGMNNSQLNNLNDIELTDNFLEHMKNALPTPNLKLINELSQSLYKVKWQRDKTIAHNEIFNKDNEIAPNFQEINRLLEYAKKFVIAIGWGYTSFCYSVDNDYLLTKDARMNAYFLRWLLIRACVISGNDREQERFKHWLTKQPKN